MCGKQNLCFRSIFFPEHHFLPDYRRSPACVLPHLLLLFWLHPSPPPLLPSRGKPLDLWFCIKTAYIHFVFLCISFPPPFLPSPTRSRGAFGYCSRTGSGVLCGRCSGEPGRPARRWRSSVPPHSECQTHSNTLCTGGAEAR